MKLMQRLLGSYYDIAWVRLVAEFFLVIIPVAFLIRTFLFGLYMVPTPSMETTLLMGERFFGDKLTYWFRKPQRGEIIAFNAPKYNYSSNKMVNLWQRYASWRVDNWTKRVIGLPGERIQGIVENGSPILYINGKKFDESAYINKYPIIYVWKYPRGEQANSNSALNLLHKFTRQDSSSMQRALEVKSFDPNVPWGDKQPFYAITPSQIVLNASGEPATVLWPGTPHYEGKDNFDITLKENQYWVMGDNRLGSSDCREWGPLDGQLIHSRIIYRLVSIDSGESWWFVDLLKNPLGMLKKIRWSRCLQWIS